MRKEIEVLEDHPDLFTDLGQFRLVLDQIDPVNDDGTGRRELPTD